MTNTKTLCLCMIVKNESKVIARAINSVRSIIDYWVICDTGSTDSTQSIIISTLSDIPGELHQTEWVNFGHNREDCLGKAKGKSDYILILDADMIANIATPFKHKLYHDSYEIRYEGNLDYSQPMLVSNHHDWNYVGVTHEYIESPTAKTKAFLNDLTLKHFGDGGMRSDKYDRDIKLLSKELESEPDNLRNIFYLAQSYRDLGLYEEALEWYTKRINLGGGWEEESWYALYQIAFAQQKLNYDWNIVLKSYLDAYKFRPTRLEPIYHIANYYREHEEYHMGYLYATVISDSIIYPSNDFLFIDRSIYSCKLLLEQAICAFGIGRVNEAIKSFNKILKQKDVLNWVFDSAIRGRAMSLDLLYKPSEKNVGRKNKIKVFIPFYNPGHFLDNCVESLLTQDYEHFEAIFLDDASTDDSFEKIPEDERFQLIRNKSQKGLGYNHHYLLTNHCDPDDIIVHLDGDDWLACEDALSHINQFYNDNECWVMYGQFQYSTGDYGISQPFASMEDFQKLRSSWKTSHIRTFRAGVYHKIAEQDPSYKCMKDEKGEWLDVAIDGAIMYPIVELSGFSRVRFNNKILYTYNVKNPLNVHKIKEAEEAATFNEIKLKRPFQKINSYLPTKVQTKKTTNVT